MTSDDHAGRVKESVKAMKLSPEVESCLINIETLIRGAYLSQIGEMHLEITELRSMLRTAQEERDRAVVGRNEWRSSCQHIVALENLLEKAEAEIDSAWLETGVPSDIRGKKSLSEIVKWMKVQIIDDDDDDFLHPCGRCTCAGDGKCQWCLETAEKEKVKP